jgi:hypothetical protein
VHIAGNVYDYQCEPCVTQTDFDFNTFLDHPFDEDATDG